ncbi:predicted protein [Sclerotinia sclerotiorum 1980 UF-70]|uniref:Uncharacterized protein n=1 Tax=Sclerotinia sclerotiorum (strain ATCC 18683 / 1980 / Ss-1) TaxID=665079 RepID=A7EKS6_SCLS1|nr:predicted protein [Sclerotinia sclerotiorum 1980 UF-70]EDO03442.1 predicted protein [Sclerotinia sclerotiorum 1980 UF-70]
MAQDSGYKIIDFQEHNFWDMSNLIGSQLRKAMMVLIYIDDILQGAYNSKIKVSKAVIWMQNPTQLIPYKAGKELVFIYRPLEEALRLHNGFFKVVEGSHYMRPEEFLKPEAIEIHVKSGQVLLLDGETVIEYLMAGGSGIGLMRCLSKSKH